MEAPQFSHCIPRESTDDGPNFSSGMHRLPPCVVCRSWRRVKRERDDRRQKPIDCPTSAAANFSGGGPVLLIDFSHVLVEGFEAGSAGDASACGRAAVTRANCLSFGNSSGRGRSRRPRPASSTARSRRVSGLFSGFRSALRATRSLAQGSHEGRLHAAGSRQAAVDCPVSHRLGRRRVSRWRHTCPAASHRSLQSPSLEPAGQRRPASERRDGGFNRFPQYEIRLQGL